MASAAADDELVNSKSHQRHDLFNVICLPVVVAVNLASIYVFFVSTEREEDSLDFMWNIQIGVLNAYIFLDTIYILLNPSCVSAFKTVVAHHCIVFLGWIAVPHQYPQLRPIATCLLSVEINTLFMIARKFQKFQKYPMLIKFLRYGFYITWLPLRVVIFPFSCYLGYLETIKLQKESGSFVNMIALGTVLLSVITLLNLKWTFDLFFGQRKKVTT